MRVYVSITNMSRPIELYQFLLHITIKPSDIEKANSSFVWSTRRNLRMNIYFDVAKNLETLILISISYKIP